MINKLDVASIWVLDKDEALDFYVNKLGLEVGSDIRQGDYRWLTVRVPGNPGTEISLEQPGSPLHDEATAAQIRELITKGAMGGLVFHTDGCPGPVRGAEVPRRRGLHPGADRPLLRDRHGRPRSVRQPDPDPPAGQGPPGGHGLTPAGTPGRLTRLRPGAGSPPGPSPVRGVRCPGPCSRSSSTGSGGGAAARAPSGSRTRCPRA